MNKYNGNTTIAVTTKTNYKNKLHHQNRKYLVYEINILLKVHMGRIFLCGPLSKLTFCI